jgi:hypothetical protein
MDYIIKTHVLYCNEHSTVQYPPPLPDEVSRARICKPFKRSPGIDYQAWRPALQRQNTEISKQIFPEKEYRGLSPDFYIPASVSDLYIPTAIGLPILLEEICRPLLGLHI